MKHTFFGILFTFIYLLAMVRPILPVIEYYINYDYINEQLCENRDKPYLKCNGTCYLEKQLDKIDIQHPDKKPLSALIFDLKDYPISTLDFCNYTYQKFVVEKNIQKIITPQNFASSLMVFDIFHPPLSA